MKMKKLSVFFLHGRKGSPNGKKVQFLRGSNFLVHGISMDCKNKNFKDPKEYKSVLKNCVNSQRGEILNKGEKYDFYIGSSFGGAVLIELMKEVGLIRHESHIILLAPAQRDQDFDSFDNLKEFKSVRIFHGDNDKIVKFENSLQLSAFLDWELVRVEDGHALRSILHKKENGLFDVMMKMASVEEEEEDNL